MNEAQLTWGKKISQVVSLMALHANSSTGVRLVMSSYPCDTGFFSNVEVILLADAHMM